MGLIQALEKEWHPTLNGATTPKQVINTSSQKVWWQCSKHENHEWIDRINNRYKGKDCPFCSNERVLPGYNDLATKYPELASEWHPTKNFGCTPRVVSYTSEELFWWQCREHEEHYWIDSIYDRNNGYDCPHCLGGDVYPGFQDLPTINPARAKQWHPTLNGGLTPENVTAGSFKKVWWTCSENHVWQSAVREGGWCPYCSNRKVLPGYNELATTHPELAAEWHPTLNGGFTPLNVTQIFNQRVWWQCDKGHEWKADVRHRVKGWAGCPQCKKLGKFSARMHEIDKQRRQRELLESAGVQSEATPENK